MIKRIFLLRTDFLDIDKLSKILLYTLMVSHAIRIDTVLVIEYGKKCYILKGEELRHLYPQEKSLQGFVKTIFYKEKKMPGVYIVRDKELLKKIISCNKALIVKYAGNKPKQVFMTCTRELIQENDCIIIPLYSLECFLKDILGYMNCNNISYLDISVGKYGSIEQLVTIVHYVIDINLGGWIRRKGEVRYVKGVYNKVMERRT